MNKKAMQQIVDRENFNPHPCNGGELPFAVACVGNPKFQPISHLRGQLEKAQLFIWYMAILIHIPVWG